MDLFNIWTVAVAAIVCYYWLEYKKMEKQGNEELLKEIAGLKERVALLEKKPE